MQEYILGKSTSIKDAMKRLDLEEGCVLFVVDDDAEDLLLKRYLW